MFLALHSCGVIFIVSVVICCKWHFIIFKYIHFNKITLTLSKQNVAALTTKNYETININLVINFIKHLESSRHHHADLNGR